MWLFVTSVPLRFGATAIEKLKSMLPTLIIYFIELQAKLILEEDEPDLSVRLRALQSRFANQMENFDLLKISETKLWAYLEDPGKVRFFNTS